MHVLSTPPAFVLSQDQTLQKRIQNPADPTSRRGRDHSINQIKHLASTIQYDTLLSSQETDTLTAYYRPHTRPAPATGAIFGFKTTTSFKAYCFKANCFSLRFPLGFPRGVPNSIRFSRGLFPPPSPPSSLETVRRPSGPAARRGDSENIRQPRRTSQIEIPRP